MCCGTGNVKNFHLIVRQKYSQPDPNMLAVGRQICLYLFFTFPLCYSSVEPSIP